MEPSTDPAPLAVARAEFAKYHRLATGTDAPEELVSLAVDPSVSETGNDAYAIVSAGGGATVTGSNPRSVLYGVYDLLARRAGCRWFWDGDIVPRCAAIDLSGLDVHEESRFRYRAIRYFAHRGLTRFQAEHWGFDDWRREIDWCVKRRLNCILPRIGMDDLWQRAFPDVVPYPDPAKPLPGAGTGYDDRSPFWPLQFRGRLRRAVADYAFARGLRIPADFGTMTHWYSRTPREFLEREKPAFLPQAGGDYGEPDGRVFDVRDRKWLDAYWRLTEAAVDAGYCSPDLLHTIGLGERTVYADRARNLALKTDVLRRLLDLAAEKAPGAPVLLAGWDFHFGWTPEEVRTALAALDPERVVLWDYEADAAPVPRPDRTRTAFTDWGVVGRFPYTFGAFLAYEQALDVRANYPLLENRLAVAENDPACKGFLFWPESSHTDVFALRWFSENAWRPGGKTADALLPAFCRDRYGAQAALFESVWRLVLPVGALEGWGGNCASRLAFHLDRLPEDWPDEPPPPNAEKPLREARAAFALLARIEWSDAFAARDSVDLARTLLDRTVERRRRETIRAFRAWAGGDDAAARAAREAADAFAAGFRSLADLLALHTDYSLWESLERLDAVERVANPDFPRTLVDNATNAYCLSHQFEAVDRWCAPLAASLARAVRRKLDAGDRTPLDRAALAAESEALRAALLATPLRDLRPAAPRTVEAFRAVLARIREGGQPRSVAPHRPCIGDKTLAGPRSSGTVVVVR